MTCDLRNPTDSLTLFCLFSKESAISTRYFFKWLSLHPPYGRKTLHEDRVRFIVAAVGRAGIRWDLQQAAAQKCLFYFLCPGFLKGAMAFLR